MPKVNQQINNALDEIVTRTLVVDPALDVVNWRAGLVAMLEGWNGQSTDAVGVGGSRRFPRSEAIAWCNELEALGVAPTQVTRLRTWFGV